MNIIRNARRLRFQNYYPISQGLMSFLCDILYIDVVVALIFYIYLVFGWKGCLLSLTSFCKTRYEGFAGNLGSHQGSSDVTKLSFCHKIYLFSHDFDHLHIGRLWYLNLSKISKWQITWSLHYFNIFSLTDICLFFHSITLWLLEQTLSPIVVT